MVLRQQLEGILRRANPAKAREGKARVSSAYLAGKLGVKTCGVKTFEAETMGYSRVRRAMKRPGVACQRAHVSTGLSQFQIRTPNQEF